MHYKKLFTIFFICSLLFSLAGCGSKADSPPSLKIIYRDKSIEAKTGTYSWDVDNGDGSFIGIEYDTVAPAELVKDSTPLTVPPGSSLTLSFSVKPEDIIVYAWQGNEPIKQSVTGDKIITPGSAGSIVYEVIGTWEQGTVRYAFLVNVV